MWGLINAFLKALVKGAVKGAAKEGIKGAAKTGITSALKAAGKEAIKSSGLMSLKDAFSAVGTMGQKIGAAAKTAGSALMSRGGGGGGGGAAGSTPSPQTGTGMGSGIPDANMLSNVVNSPDKMRDLGLSGTDPLTPYSVQTGQVPQNQSIIAGGVKTEMPTNVTAIPDRYKSAMLAGSRAGAIGGDMNQQALNARAPSRGSILAGLKEGALGMPNVNQYSSPWYYAGQTIPEIVRSRLGATTAPEATRQYQSQQQAQRSEARENLSDEITTQKLSNLKEENKRDQAFRKDLGQAMKFLGRKGGLSEDQKVLLYQQVAQEYPEYSAQIKRIFFPNQSNDFNDLLNRMMGNYFSGAY